MIFLVWFCFGKPAVRHSVLPCASHSLEIIPNTLSEDDVIVARGASPTVQSSRWGYCAGVPSRDLIAIPIIPLAQFLNANHEILMYEEIIQDLTKGLFHIQGQVSEFELM